MEWNRDETIEMAENKKAERSRNHDQGLPTNSDYNHSPKMVKIRGN